MIACATFAYPQLDTDKRGLMATRLVGREAPSEAFVLATCLRIEVAVAGGEAELEDALGKVFGPGGYVPPRIAVGEAALEHLFRVAAGLESPILGEAEVFAQFRQAAAEARSRGAAPRLLEALEAAVAAGRRARELLPPSPHASLGSVAAQVVGDVHTVGVVGFGVMSKAVVGALSGLPSRPALTVLARDPGSVRAGDCAVWPLDRLPQALASFDAVVSATAASRQLLSASEMAQVLAGRSAPLVLVDMAMPPDFAPPAGTPVVHYDIDDLARIVEDHEPVDRADEYIAAAARTVHRRMRTRAGVGPVASALTASADDVVARVVDRFAGRLSSAEDEAVLQQATHTVARTLLAGPLAYLNDAADDPESIDAIVRAFRLDHG